MPTHISSYPTFSPGNYCVANGSDSTSASLCCNVVDLPVNVLYLFSLLSLYGQYYYREEEIRWKFKLVVFPWRWGGMSFPQDVGVSSPVFPVARKTKKALKNGKGEHWPIRRRRFSSKKIKFAQGPFSLLNTLLLLLLLPLRLIIPRPKVHKGMLEIYGFFFFFR